jgi:hypothetical protein
MKEWQPPKAKPRAALVLSANRKMGKKFRKIHVAFPILNMIRGINDGTRMITGDPG